MGVFSKAFKGFTSWIDPAGAFVGRETGIADYLAKRPTPPSPLAPPTQDTAANANLQTQQNLLRRRGILGNIYAGGSPSTPATTSKTALGN